MTMTPIITQSDLAAQLGICSKTLRKMTNAGQIPVWFRDDTGRPVYSTEVIAAHQRRAGELHAERQAA